jgi:hypothetical protein
LGFTICDFVGVIFVVYLPMKKMLLMRKFLLFTLFLTKISLAQKADSANAAIIVFDSLEYNFGTVTQGTVLDHDFHFTNRGKEPLVVTNAGTYTTSDVASYTQEPIRPGARGVIHYKFDTGGKINAQDKVIVVYSNAVNGNVILHTKGNVIAPPVVQPVITPRVVQPATPKPLLKFDTTTFDCGNIVSGETASHDFYYTNIGYDHAVILNVTGDGRCYGDATVDPVPPNQSGYVHVFCGTNGMIGEHIRTVSVAVNDGNRYETIVLHLNYVNVPRDSAALMNFGADTLLLGKLKAGESKTVEFHFTNTGQKPLVISDAIEGGERIMGYPKDPIPPGGTGVISLSFTAPDQKGPFTKTITVHSNNRDGDINLRVIGEVK